MNRFPYAPLAPALQSCWTLPLRLIAGFGFMEHGWAKLTRGPGSFAGILDALSMPAPALLAWITIVVELGGAAAVLAGWLLRVAAVPMLFVLLVAIVPVHLPNGFSSIKLQTMTATGAHFGQPGYETDLLYAACLIALMIGGSGPLALDDLLGRGGRYKASRDREDPRS